MATITETEGASFGVPHTVAVTTVSENQAVVCYIKEKPATTPAGSRNNFMCNLLGVDSSGTITRQAEVRLTGVAGHALFRALGTIAPALLRPPLHLETSTCRVAQTTLYNTNDKLCKYLSVAKLTASLVMVCSEAGNLSSGSRRRNHVCRPLRVDSASSGYTLTKLDDKWGNEDSTLITVARSTDSDALTCSALVTQFDPVLAQLRSH